ncbi:MAG: adventurous gliding motility lipoprotein CglB [Archangium sp.]|nr:adventurous gliding motility lipoprotein CglB [Archangium sp.]
MMRSVALFTVLLFAGSCQTYDFERVVPLAVAQTTDKTIVASKRLKPNVMILVDNSGSMEAPISPCAAAPTCGSPGNRCPPGCPTRISELKSAMATFLQTSATIARLGVTKFPVDSLCAASSNVNVQFPAKSVTDDGTDPVLSANAQLANGFIQALVPEGGTPTGASLDFLGTYQELNNSGDSNDDFRDDFVLLLTDGLPNCNDANPNQLCSCGGTCSAAQISSCSCTTSTCTNTLCAKGCLDRDNAVDRVKALRMKEIRTIVVGFGADLTSGSGRDVLNAMAIEGGFARDCPNGTDAECGAGGSCNNFTKKCTTSFFQASNGTELAAALRKISESFLGDPCEFLLSARPSNPAYLAVIVNGQSLAAGPTTYSFDPASNKVTFLGAQCTALNASTAQNPVNVEFRIVERF